MSEHQPTERDHGTGYTVDCSCGRVDVLWSTALGARTNYLEHLVEEVAADNDWPETYTVDGDDTYVGDAS